MEDIRQQVKDYYSKITVEEEGNMETSICSCAIDGMPDHLKAIRSEISDEIVNRFYGCALLFHSP